MLINLIVHIFYCGKFAYHLNPVYCYKEIRHIHSFELLSISTISKILLFLPPKSLCPLKSNCQFFHPRFYFMTFWISLTHVLHQIRASIMFYFCDWLIFLSILFWGLTYVLTCIIFSWFLKLGNILLCNISHIYTFISLWTIGLFLFRLLWIMLWWTLASKRLWKFVLSTLSII